MENATTSIIPAPVPGSLASLPSQVRDYAWRRWAPKTRTDYEQDWNRRWVPWALAHGLPPIPADPVAICTWIVELAQRNRVSTIDRRLAAVAAAHTIAGMTNPCADPRVRAVRAGIARSQGTRPRKKDPVCIDELRAAVRGCGWDLWGIRDRAMILFGWAGAFRRSEVVTFCVEHIDERPEGLAVLLPWSKTDQEGRGEITGIPHASEHRGAMPELCPPCHVLVWLDAAGIDSGPIFRPVYRGGAVGDRALDPQSVALRVKHALRLVEGDWAGHSLRRGLATQAARNETPVDVIAKHGRWRNLDTVMGYIDEANPFRRNAATMAGL